MTAHTLPEGRYGSARGGRVPRWRKWLFGVVALVVSGATAWVAYVNLGPAPISADRVAFEEKPGNTMSVTISATRNDPSRPGMCIVRVRDKSGAEGGRKEVLIPAGQNHSRQTTLVHSIDRPVTADVFGCTYDVPTYLSSS